MRAISGYVLIISHRVRREKRYLIIGRGGKTIEAANLVPLSNIEEAEKCFKRKEKQSMISTAWLAELSMVIAENDKERNLPIFKNSRSLIGLCTPHDPWLLWGSNYMSFHQTELPIPFKKYESALRSLESWSKAYSPYHYKNFCISTYHLKKIRRLK